MEKDFNVKSVMLNNDGKWLEVAKEFSYSKFVNMLENCIDTDNTYFRLDIKRINSQGKPEEWKKPDKLMININNINSITFRETD